MNKEKKTRKSRFPKSGIGYRKIQEVFKAYGLQQSTYRFWYTRSWRVSSLIMVSLSLPPSYSSILAMDSVSWA